MKLPVSKSYDSILVVYDRFLKMLHFVVTTEKITAEELARLFRDNMWKLHGLPESVISDKGPQFVAGLTRELNKMLGIETKLFMAYHSQTDREDKLRAGVVFKNVHRSQAKQLVRMVGNCRICI